MREIARKKDPSACSALVPFAETVEEDFHSSQELESHGAVILHWQSQGRRAFLALAILLGIAASVRAQIAHGPRTVHRLASLPEQSMPQLSRLDSADSLSPSSDLSSRTAGNSLGMDHGQIHEIDTLSSLDTPASLSPLAPLPVPQNVSSPPNSTSLSDSLWEPTAILGSPSACDSRYRPGESCDLGCDTLGSACCNSRIQVPPIFSCPANQCADAACWLGEFFHRVDSCETGLEVPPRSQGNYGAWWDELVTRRAGIAEQVMPIRVGALIQQALVSSPHVQVAATEPHIQNTILVEEQSKFDWRAFLETQYDNLNDPIGNTLTTGNNDDRFRQREFYARGGVRRRNTAGGEFDISQRIGTLRNNSRFLIPPQQGNSRLELNYTQPLLNGRGRYVNESLVMLARIDYASAGDQFLIELQGHLLLVTEAYWELYRARANYYQRRRLLDSAKAILENLEGRAAVDSLDRQVLRAKAAVASRRSEITRALTRIKNAQSQLRLLVNDDSLLNSSCYEFLPSDQPLNQDLGVAIGDALATALSHRPDISQAIRELRSTAVRLGVAKNDLLPQLDLLVSTYVAGLNGNTDVYAAYVNQFNDGRPGFTVGLQFEVPLGNRGAWARHERRKWEMTRAVGQFRAVTESALTEVEVSYREVSTTHREMVARHQAMQASGQETDYLVDRWKTLPELNDSSTLLLEDLLDSQERLTDEEDAFVQAQVNYAVALVKLRQAMGTLLQVSGIGG